jgi:hypothetical protein
MTVYKLKVSTRDARFYNRSIKIVTSQDGKVNTDVIPISNEDVICDVCNENVYDKTKDTYGWMLYLTTDDMLQDRPYGFYCDKCITKYFPKAKECYKI